MVLLLIILTFLKKIFTNENQQEGFIDEQNFLFKEGDAVYDDFYASVYDYLTFNQIKNDYEVGIVINSAFANEKSVIADIGCGTGHNVNELSKQISNLSIIGIDKSPSMIEKAKEYYPNLQFKIGDGLEETLFNNNSLTHILCLNFTIYHIKNKNDFFYNCIQWLMPGGYLIVHLVDRNHFKPFFNPNNPLYIIKPLEKNGNKKIKIDSEDFSYNANYNLDDNNIAIIKEKFKFKNGQIRKQEQQLYMEDISSIVSIAQDQGFLVHAKINMSECSYEYNYLYVFVKPN